MADEAMFQEALTAIDDGQRERARDLLTRLLKIDPANPSYWLWLSSVVDTPKERLVCLQMVLQFDPDNISAQYGMVLLGTMPPQDKFKPLPIVPRKWVPPEIIKQPSEEKGKLSRIKIDTRTIGFAIVLTVVFFSVLIFGINAFRGGEEAPHLTITPKWTPRPTNTAVPSNTSIARLMTSTYVGLKPLSMYLKATYTPTPLYVNTPHPISEAYRAGIRAFLVGDYSNLLLSMEQAIDYDPQAADIYYYIGEAQALLGNLKQALAAYEKAITTNHNFAPAYLGRARILRKINPKQDISDDLDKSIALDPNLVEAYLERAASRLSKGLYTEALEDLQVVENLRSDSPLLNLYRAQVYLALNENNTALIYAKRAHDLDFTLIEGYLVLGQANLQAGSPQIAVTMLITYTLYENQDALGWLTLGQAIYKNGGPFIETVKNIDKALTLNPGIPNAYLYRGLANLEMDNNLAAVDDLNEAVTQQPKSYQANLEFGRALLMVDRDEDALRVINNALTLANTDAQLAAVYYWRAQIYEAMGNKNSAALDWIAFLEIVDTLPADSTESKWERLAQEHLLALTPTPLLSITPSTQASVTVTPRYTPTPIPTATRTPTP